MRHLETLTTEGARLPAADLETVSRKIGDRDPTAVPRHFAIWVSSNCRQLVDDRGAINSTRDLYGKTQAEFALGIDVE